MMNLESHTPSHLFLTGYRGCGKTTLAIRLSDKLQMPLIDTDEWIERTVGKTIAEIFQDDGEEAFRDAESLSIAKLRELASPHVVSLGGGAILREANRTNIRSLGWIAWLTAAPETISQRINSDSTSATRRPALSKLGQLEEINSLLAKREPLYRQVAHCQYATDKIALLELTEQVCADYRNWLRTTNA